MLFTFAKKYLLSRKNTRAINIISWVSVGSIAIGTAALLVVLSAFNGIDFFVRSLYSTFYTDVKITVIQGKTFAPDTTLVNWVSAQKGCLKIGKALEDNVLVTAGEKQSIITLRGVDENLAKITNLNKSIRYGDTNLFIAEPRVMMGLGVANRLSVSEQSLAPISIYVFQKDANLSQAPQDAYKTMELFVGGIFTIQEEFDSKYCITSLQHLQALQDSTSEISSLELQTASAEDAEKIVNDFNKKYATKNLVAATRYEQNKTLYYVLKSEKWMVYAIMSFMLLIASFNIIGSLSMLVLEKKKDIFILKSLGTKEKTIKDIFLSTGLLIGLIGAIIGVILALGFCLLQQHFKLVKMAGENLLLDAYPVLMKGSDFILVFVTVIAISFIAAWAPSRKAVSS